MNNKLIKILPLLCICVMTCGHIDEAKANTADYLASGCRYEKQGCYLLAIVNFQQAMRGDRTYKQEALAHAQACAHSFESIKNWPPLQKDTAKTIADVFQKIEQQWNQHDIQAEMAHFDAAYINSDGFNKFTVTAQTLKLWETYPDVQIKLDIAGLAVQDDCAIVRWTSTMSGHTAFEEPGLAGKGKLASSSTGLSFFTRTEKTWKLVGQVTEAEDVIVNFGKSESVISQLASPSEVHQDAKFSATCKQSLPPGTVGVCSITSMLLEYPLRQPKDVWIELDPRGIAQCELSAPTEYKNALVMATTGLTDAARTKFVGYQFRTNRIIVIPKDSDLNLPAIVAHGPPIPPIQRLSLREQQK
ncbi:MAG: hypothetical protein ACRD3W_13785 [Terriglobales bacterium]